MAKKSQAKPKKRCVVILWLLSTFIFAGCWLTVYMFAVIHYGDYHHYELLYKGSLLILVAVNANSINNAIVALILFRAAKASELRSQTPS